MVLSDNILTSNRDYSNIRFQQDLTSYVLALLTDDEAGGSPSASPLASPSASPGGPAGARDLLLYADCELAVLAAPAARYDHQAVLVRQEYPHLSRIAYSELRLKVYQLCNVDENVTVL